MESIWYNVKINILLALTNETWQLEVMSNINEQNQLKIKRRCVDSVDLMSAIHLGLANKIVVSADFPNLNIETIVNAKKLGCDIYGIYLQDDLDSAEKLKNIGVSTNFAINASDNNKSLKALVSQLSNITEIDKFSSGLEELTQIPGLINVWGINGSPGRTTTAINLAFSLANKNSPTLLIDLDVVAPSIAASLGIVSEVPGISSVIHDALKGKLNIQSFEKNVIEVNSGLHVLTGITNPKRWPELRTEGLLQVLKQASQIYPNIVCDLSAVLPETLDPNLNNLDIFRRFDHIPKVLELSSQLIFVSNANPLGLIRSSESLEALSEFYKREPLIVLNKVNSFNLGAKYESTVEAILGRWTNPEQIQRIPDRPELFAGSWLKAESVLNLGDGEIVGIFNKISNMVRNEVSKPPKSKRFLRRVS
jgi:MinD-like ATPase involved in chromosome partitioning or flagellar assembly